MNKWSILSCSRGWIPAYFFAFTILAVAPGDAQDVHIVAGEGNVQDAEVLFRDDWIGKVRVAWETPNNGALEEFVLKFNELVSFRELTIDESLRWGFDFVRSPEAAQDRQLMHLYPMATLDPDDWEGLYSAHIAWRRDRVSDPRVALVWASGEPSAGALTLAAGAPFKWNEEFAAAMQTGFQERNTGYSEDSNPLSSALVAAAAALAAVCDDLIAVTEKMSGRKVVLLNLDDEEADSIRCDEKTGVVHIGNLNSLYFASEVKTEFTPAAHVKALTSKSAWPPIHGNPFWLRQHTVPLEVRGGVTGFGGVSNID